MLRQIESAEAAVRAAAPGVRLVRVVREPPAVPVEQAPPGGAPRAAVAGSAITPEPVVVECGALRVAVRPGFDRQTLAAVLELVAQAGPR